MATASEFWNFLHDEIAPMLSDGALHAKMQRLLDSGADDSMLEECIESLESAANLMRGMTLDMKIPPIARDVLRGRCVDIDALTERLTMSDPQAADVRPERKGDE